ncbi:uncharacterized protein FOMMEDRAFT_158831 [Fomitiporia mediterranea MF3/22]|uniref:uncharacterized protein n=1 Tax=Fomitiporia mediterranea (strain MF3/22) TaxID=694068 RepID=UPI00044081AD|nr:uncharacterized protein FOMMEDRAFT_158831 [Fomitiporia mediterranea MF3/22]EJD01677.1 hypothetical protein FOMMEDRAFT_158831 [Fomitiporia mediterranea MF3/22]
MAVKRKSDTTSVAASSKKRKSTSSSSPEYTFAKSLITSVLADPKSCSLDFDVSDGDAVRQVLCDIANYTRSLEEEVEELKTANANGTRIEKEKSPEEMKVAVTRLTDLIVRGIKRQLTWKPNCKTNSAKFVFDGLCPDPLVFGAILKLDGPPKFKLKKMSGSEFEGLVGEIVGSARYNDLYITKSDINIRYNADSGEFKISGCYGISPV